MPNGSDLFRKLASITAASVGSSYAFLAAVVSILIWAALGPVFGFSAAWQLVINTGTTIVTFLMVFLIQNAQNREGAALQLKLDEIIRVLGPARNKFVDLENCTDAQLRELRAEFQRIVNRPQTSTA